MKKILAWLAQILAGFQHWLAERFPKEWASLGQGAGITDSATKNNYLTHKQQVDWHNAISLCETTECKDELTAYYNELDSKQLSG